MTAIVALGGYADAGELEERGNRMIQALQTAGAGSCAAQVLRSPGALLASSHPDWHDGVRSAAAGASTSASPVPVVCDASLYYLSDLAGKLEIPARDAQRMRAADLIGLAYKKFGAGLVHHLEGDYAFVLRDPRNGAFLAGRDIAGKRALYHAIDGKHLIVASSIRSILAHGRVGSQLNLAVIAETAAASWPSAQETCYLAISELPAGHLLSWNSSQNSPSITSFWHPPPQPSGRPLSTADAAHELRALLMAAVHERMPAGMPTAVSLSGGWDSPSVFAAGNAVLRENASGNRSIVPISISYPVGDAGREDDLIISAAKHWGATPRWIQSTSMPMLSNVVSGGISR
jgi:asparagine synthetase B (glutamine-hydrolysing)